MTDHSIADAMAPKGIPMGLDDNHWNTIQEILNAMGDMPDIAGRIDAYMRGRGIDDPEVEIAALRSIAF